MLLSPEQVYALTLNAVPQVAKKYPVPDQVYFARLLVAQSFQESCTKKNAPGYVCFDTSADPKSSSARGIFQTLKGTQPYIETLMGWPHRDLDARYDPEYSALLGAAYMAYQYSRYRDHRKALKAYHDGHYSTRKTKGDTYASLIMDKFYKLFDWTTYERNHNGIEVLASGLRPEYG